ncbi:MAG: hypothetical protein ACOX7P_05255 [Oscillospiraceae bacterium]
MLGRRGGFAISRRPPVKQNGALAHGAGEEVSGQSATSSEQADEFGEIMAFSAEKMLSALKAENAARRYKGRVR